MHFDRPEYLWLFGFLPLVLFFLGKYLSTGRSVRKLLGKSATSSFLPPGKRERLAAAFVCIGVICLVAALARPYLEETVEKPEFQKMNLVFLLDVSPSMNTRDVWPSRMDRSKEVIRRFIERDTGVSRFGLVSFSESSVILSYLTSDLQNLLFYLDFLRPDRNLILGTDIGAALMSGLHVLEKRAQIKQPAEDPFAQRSVLVLISDGEDHGESLNQAIDRMRQKRIRVHTIGVGTSAGGIMPVVNDRGEREYLKDEHGRRLVSQLSVETLGRVAQETRGRSFQASSGLELESALQSILEAERQVIGYKVGTWKRELFRYFVALTFFSQLLVMTLRL